MNTDTEKFSKVVFDSKIHPAECTICYENFEHRQRIYITECSHTFCVSCLDRWMQQHIHCPMCRGQLREGFSFQIPVRQVSGDIDDLYLSMILSVPDDIRAYHHDTTSTVVPVMEFSPNTTHNRYNVGNVGNDDVVWRRIQNRNRQAIQSYIQPYIQPNQSIQNPRVHTREEIIGLFNPPTNQTTTNTTETPQENVTINVNGQSDYNDILSFLRNNEITFERSAQRINNIVAEWENEANRRTHRDNLRLVRPLSQFIRERREMRGFAM
jgi:hypothetical protein